jgi:predicted AAA+ superfamily ATPase
LQKLFDIQQIIFSQFEKQPFYPRKVFKKINLDNYVTGIVGTRGIGKTTFLLHSALIYGAKERLALYVSADNLYFLDHSLVDLVDQLYKQTDVRLLCIDEIHKYPNWNQELKNIADTFPEFRILFSGSSTIDLISGKYDLSRRVTLFYLHGLSFREYLEITLHKHFSVVSLEELVRKRAFIAPASEDSKILKHFQEYLRVGYYPFFSLFSQEKDKFQAIENTTQKTIYEDIGTLHTLKTPTLSLIEQLFKFVINSPPGELSAYRLASNLGKDFESISTYLRYLQEAGLIRFIYPPTSGNAALRNPIKMFPENTNLIFSTYLPLSQDKVLGKIRETFVINQLQNAEQTVFYSDKGDFKINDMIFEVGGVKKSGKQIKGVSNAYILADGILVGAERQIPLHLLGFLY